MTYSFSKKVVFFLHFLIHILPYKCN